MMIINIIILFIQLVYSALELDCLIFFGDSLSDPGNLHNLTLGFKPDRRYWNGRYSNGPVWSEYLEQFIKVKNKENWSYAGATTDIKLTNRFGFVPSLKAQLNWFKSKSNSCYNSMPSNHLVSYVAGVNNYVNASVTPSMTLKDIRWQLNFLINELKFKNLFISDLPPIQDSPMFTGKFLKLWETSENYHNDPKIKDKVNEHNLLLEALVKELQNNHPGVNLYFWKFEKFWELAKQLNPYNSSKWNTELPCFDGSKDPEGCKNPSDYFFFDTGHPITEVHKFLAKEIAIYLNNNWKN